MTTAPSSPATVAFMDIGTNSVRLLVVRIDANQSFTVLHQMKETVRLGEDEFSSGRLRLDAIDRAVIVICQFAHVAATANATEIVAVATAATREAENQRAFLDRIRQEAGVEVHVVSGKEEARLIYLGVASGVHLDGRNIFSIDIGGGSTEVSVGSQDEHVYLNSLRLGAIRLTSMFLAGRTDPVPARLYKSIRRYVRDNAAETLAELRAHPFEVAFGSSGTIESLADVSCRLVYGRPWQRDDSMYHGNLKQAVTLLCSLPVEQRREVPGLNPARADIVIAGAAILDTIMEELGIRELRVSERGLREGLLIDYLRRHGHGSIVDGGSVRERSVLQLGRRCQFNEAHALTTARLAKSLFDSAAAAGLHTFGDNERELLEYGAILHHIGSFLTHGNYQRHSSYLIKNADLLGFDQNEIAIMAATVLFHRSALARKKDSTFASLSPAAQERVLILSGLLRLAENLDRSQAGIVEDARLERIGNASIGLCVQAGRDWQVELSGVENQREAFEKTFGGRLVIQRD